MESARRGGTKREVKINFPVSQLVLIGVAVATSINVGVADGIIDKYKVGVFKNDYTSFTIKHISIVIYFFN